MYLNVSSLQIKGNGVVVNVTKSHPATDVERENTKHGYLVLNCRCGEGKSLKIVSSM